MSQSQNQRPPRLFLVQIVLPGGQRKMLGPYRKSKMYDVLNWATSRGYHAQPMRYSG